MASRLGTWSPSAWASSLPRAAAAEASSGAGLLEAPRLAGDRVDSGVDVDMEGPARELLDVASGGGGQGSTMTQNADIRSTTRSTTVIVGVRIKLSTELEFDMATAADVGIPLGELIDHAFRTLCQVPVGAMAGSCSRAASLSAVPVNGPVAAKDTGGLRLQGPPAVLANTYWNRLGLRTLSRT